MWVENYADAPISLRIPVHAGHRFRLMTGHDSGACRATVPVMPGHPHEGVFL
jgi:hypothetical protein